jgi:hypothetical protein
MQAITCRLVGQTYWQSVLISPFRPALLCAPSTHALCGRSSKIQRRKLIRCRQPAAHELMGVIRPPASSAPASLANGCKRKRGLWRDDVTARRFPPPWTVEEQAACFVARDHNGQALSYVYYESEPGRQTAAKPLTKDEARRIAVNFAKLPDFLRKER